MKKQLINIISLMVLMVGLTTTYSVQAQTSANRNYDRQAINLLKNIESKTTAYKSIVNRGYNNSEIVSYITDFETATKQLRQQLNSRQQITPNDVENVLNRANFIENYMKNNRSTTYTQSQWKSIKTDLNSLAQYYNVSWDWNNNSYNNSNNQNSTYNVSDAEIRALLNRIENRTDAYRRDVNSSKNKTYGNSNQNSLNTYIADFENANDDLKNKFNSRASTNRDVQEVLNRASVIDRVMINNRSTTQVQNQWNLVKNELNTLANYYNVSWNWNNTTYPNNPSNSNNSGDMRLTGTYRLNVSQSDNVSSEIDKAIKNNNNNNNNDRFRQNLERRLASPETLVIDKSNRQITLGSSTSPQVTINADGIARSEQTANGRTVNTKAVSNGESLTISYEGDRVNDFYVTFTPMNNGKLKVTRKLYLENQNDTITVASIYDKVNQTADWSAVKNNSNNAGYNPNGQNGNNQNGNNQSGTYYNDFVIPNGTKINAVLTSPLSTKTNVDGDKFTMEVRSPSQYRGAIIEGHVSSPQSSGRVTGRSELSLVFDRITLSNGTAYRYAGLIDEVKSSDGEKISVNNEGAVRDSNQTTKTVTRAGIGAGIGAIIGAIAGGGQGAAIGAAIGGGAGAGSVVLQGRDNLELKSGTEFNLTSSAPSNTRAGN